MRSLAACALLALLAGCASPAPGRVVLVDAPSLASILPDATEIPPGFVVLVDPDPDAAEAAGTLARVYDHALNNASVHHSLRLGVDRAGSPEAAAQACAERAAPAQGAPAAQRTAQGVFVQKQAWGDASRPQEQAVTTAAFGCDGLYLAWALEAATGEPPLADVERIVLGMLERARAAPEP